ncbi:hypothetical protein Q9233_005457 [Columba guinea]|nr:hypothetical protein Q9233_005457 [Columba guinea]
MKVNLVTRQELLAVLRWEGPSTEGIFRRAASGTALWELREALDCGLDIDIGSQPADLLAVVLKDFLRNIPSKLLVEDLYEEWVAAMERSSVEEKMEEMKVRILTPIFLIQAPPTFPPSTAESAAESLGRLEQLRTLSEDRRFTKDKALTPKCDKA